MSCTIIIVYYIKYFTKYVLIQIWHKIKAICLNKLCFKFEVDIYKIEVTMQFCLNIFLNKFNAHRLK